MDFTSFSPTQGYLRSAATVEYMNGSRDDLETSAIDYLTYGTVSAATSAVVGIINTGIAFGSLIGLADDDSQIDEHHAITAVFGNTAGDFYAKHKTGADIAGLVVGSFVPGLGAIRALRAAQITGVVKSPFQLATNIRNPDLVLGSQQLRAARESVVRTGTAGWKNPQVREAYMAGIKQQFMESAAFDLALVVTMNQNAALNPDDLGYLQAAGSVLVESLPFTFAGGAIGGGIDILRMRGAIAKHDVEQYFRTGKLLHSGFADNDGLPTGYKLAKLAGLHKTLDEKYKEFAVDDEVAQQMYTKGKAQLDRQAVQILTELNVPPEVADHLLNKIKNIEAVDETVDLLAGVTGINKVNTIDLAENTAFLNKTYMPTMVAVGDDAEDLAMALTLKQSAAAHEIGKLGQTDLAEGINNFAYSKLAESPYALNTEAQGYAYPLSPSLTAEFAARRESFGSNFKASVITRDGAWLLLPDYVGLNNGNIDLMYKATKEINGTVANKFNMSRKEYGQAVLLHELGHVKTNTPKVENLVINMMKTGEGREVLEELIQASLEMRRNDWGVKSSKNNKDLAKELAEVITSGRWKASDEWMQYNATPRELLADGHAFITGTNTRKAASRLVPNVAKFFNDNGAIAKAWDDTKVYYNTRTGQTYPSALPGINDISSKARLKKGSLVVPEMGRSFKQNAKLFQQDISKKIDFLEADAQWKIHSMVDYAKILSKPDGKLNILENNLPQMERIVTDTALHKFIAEGKITYNDQIISSVDQFKRVLTQAKQDMQIRLASLTGDVRYNENEVAKILNIDIDLATGMGTPTDDWLLYGKKDFSKPELFSMSYDFQLPEDYLNGAIGMNAVSARDNMAAEVRDLVSSEVLRKFNKILPEIKPETLYDIAPTNSRAGMLNNLRTTIGSAREKFAYVGKLLNQEKANKAKATTEEYAWAHEVFNKNGNAKLRRELAELNNLARRERYYVAGSGDEVFFVQKHKAQDFLAAAKLPLDRDSLATLKLADFGTGTINHNPLTVKLSPEMAKLAQQHVGTNKEIIRDKRILSTAKGREPAYDDLEYYSPPRELTSKDAKYHAFIAPGASIRGSDPRKFMIFANSKTEFDAKVAAIRGKYGDSYKLFTQSDASDYKKLKQEYEAGLVLDDMYFDASIASTGRTSELLPNMDIETSSNLQRMIDWTIRQRESILMQGVEVKYDDVIGQLKAIDEEFSNVARSSASKGKGEADSIWKDSIDLLMDKRGYNGFIEEQWGRVNDYIGEYGSKAIDVALDAIRRKKPQEVITPADYKAMTDSLTEAGYTPPTFDAAMAVLASPNIARSNTLPHLGKVLSSLSSTLMLRADWAHTVLQGLSTPILALPVLQEAMQALPNNKQLLELTTVTNPASGALEPTAFEFLRRGTVNFFSPEGRQFLEQLKERNIVSDYIIQYLDNLDMGALNGQHLLKDVDSKLDSLARFASKFSGFKFMEDFTRFQVAWAVKEIGAIRGIEADELWATVSSSVDKVHGVYLQNQRPQIFRGVVGQAVGLYQTYFFNFMQNMMKYVGDGNRKQAITMAAMQSSIFGIQSWPGFAQLNQLIGETNSGNIDLYSATGADDPRSNAKYLMYGLGSHVLGFPIDFYTRGDLAVRHSTVLPTSFMDFPAVSIVARGVGNIYNTAKLVAGGDTNLGQALLHGMAHNGFNRPLQGMANILRGYTTSGNGQPQFADINYVDYNQAEDMNYGAMMARVLGTRPLNESIIMDSYYRQKAYNANTRREVTAISKKIQLNLAAGTLTPQDYTGFASDYEKAGGDIQNFNAYYLRQLSAAKQPVMQQFYKEMQMDTQLSRARARIELQQRQVTPWQFTPAEIEAE